MKRAAAILISLACLLIPTAALAEGHGEEMLYNGDFSLQAAGAALPAGWSLEAYAADTAEAYSDEDPEVGATVVLINYDENDARVCQTVSVEPDSCYCLSALVRTDGVSGGGAGASLSIDNYALDGTYCYSENLTGTNEWRELAMYFTTGPEQGEVKVALRLGGYGLTSTGQAAFARVSMTEADPADAPGGVIDLMSENGSLTISASEDTGAGEIGSRDMFLLILLVCAVLGLAYIFVYRGTLRYEGQTLGREKPPKAVLPLLLIAALLLRAVLSLLFYGHPTDINCFMAWGNAALNNGLSTFYTSGMFADYPPGYMYICAALSWLCRVLGIEYGSSLMALVFKLPACIADLVSAVFVYRLARGKGLSETFSLVLAALLLYCPVLMFISGAWGQIDTLLTLGLVLSCWCLEKERRIAAGAIYGLTILMKPQALMLGPLLATAYIVSIPGPGWKKRLAGTLLGVLAAFAALCLLSLPFKGTQQGLWLVDKYLGTVTSYQYASIEAFNLPALLGGNWKTVTMPVLGIPYRVWGIVFIALSVLGSCALYAFRGRERRGALYLAGALMLMLIFTLGHYMHERYMLPVLLLLLIAYIYLGDRRVLIAFGAVSGAALLNVLAAFYIITRQEARGPMYDCITALGSLATLAACGYLCFVCWRLLLKGKPAGKLAPPDAPRPAKRPAPAVLPAIRAEEEARPWLTRRDTLCMLVLTGLYTVLTLMNLGTLKAPETCWTATEPGESVTVDFGETVHIAEYWVYGNIQNNGTLLISGGGASETYEQLYDNMFRWDDVAADITADSLTLTLYSGALKINELAFFDEDGGLLTPVRVDEAGAALFDEQETVPEAPSYFNGMYFDELYHGRTAYEHLHNLSPYENSHPPLGKLLIMLGIWVFGMCPFGWRVVGALFGAGMLPLIYCFAKRIFRDSRYALLTAGLFAFDFMHFTQTRIATVDVYAVFFILLMYYFMYRYLEADFFGDYRRSLRPLALAGLFF
ncbi:MAG: glycosyltransferase family 39 protein, partial [Clostridia bacterium]|nr:glycosyltransferase family 39 protein [Clostridia bacterium]